MDFANLTSINNLFQAWDEFRRGKRKRRDVQVFGRNLEDNLFSLYLDLKNKTYRHGEYDSFYVQDPKQRHIHKASARDRVIHHLLYKYLYGLFDPTFIYDSYSCRLGKGTHRGVLRLEKFSRQVSKNYTRPCWVLKCDIKKFFASIDHRILKQLLRTKIIDKDVLWLLDEVIDSFHSEPGVDRGIPLGNLTSQVFANIYLNELDQFVKHRLKIRYYLRYADDFIFLSPSCLELSNLIEQLKVFLEKFLNLELHPNKIILRKLSWGIDFLGYIVLPYYILPRNKTKRRMFNKLESKVGADNFNQSLQSYLGYLKHASSYKIQQELISEVWFWYK